MRPPGLRHVAVAGGQARHRFATRSELLHQQGVAAAKLQSCRRVEYVLGRRTPMDEARGRIAADGLEPLQNGYERMLSADDLGSELVEIEQLGPRIGGNDLGSFGRDDAQLRLRLRQRGLDVQPCLQGRPVAPDRLRPLAEPMP